MSDRFSDSDAALEALSALADGEAHSPDVARACAAWKDQSEARATWHAYQLIGDVMRSEDLADTTRGDTFLKNFRGRLAQEPVVLAPNAAHALRPAATLAPVLSPVVGQPLRRRAWAGPMAVAAGFVMAVGAMLSSQLAPVGGVGSDASVAGSGQGGGQLSLAPDGGQGGGAGFVSVADAMRANSVSVEGASFNRPEQPAAMIRDPQLDQALASYHTASQASERSFSGQGSLTRQVVFDAR
jgi:sigma-E factor negative regulatory protein RseA